MRGWSFKLVRVAGIAVYVHWTFLLLVAVFAGSYLLGPEDVPMADRAAAAGRAALFLLSVFGCVILHEFGHAMAARVYGIRTKDIYVLPIGGIARLEGMPRSPIQEFVVAIAGPAVNVAIALVLAMILGIGVLLDVSGAGEGADTAAGGGYGSGSVGTLLSHSLLHQLLFANILLVVFNMIPAFPMDGGRVLRAILAAMMPYEQATLAAVRVGQSVAVVGGLLAIFIGLPLLVLIAVFVFFGAQAELTAAQLRGRLEGLFVRDAMQRRFVALREHDPIGSVTEFARTGEQWDFPVVRDAGVMYEGARATAGLPALVGMITRERLVELLSESNGAASSTPASSVMATDVPTVGPHEPLRVAVERMQARNLSTLPVVERDGQDRRLIGLLTAPGVASVLDWRRRRKPSAQMPTASPMPGR
ncbi:MAG: site-2 protease family protein [Phycisphaeraceae bacterium]|nr:site-2 protease family protein [Phycisphaeraceae bacterium]